MSDVRSLAKHSLTKLDTSFFLIFRVQLTSLCLQTGKPIKLTTFYALTGRAAGTPFRGAEAAGSLDAFRRAATAAKGRVRVIGRAVSDSGVSLGLIRVFLAVRAVVRAVAKGHRSDLTSAS